MMPDKGGPGELIFRSGEAGFVFSTLSMHGERPSLFAFSTIREAADWLFSQYDVAGEDCPKGFERTADEDG